MTGSLTEIDRARELVLARAEALEIETVELEAALGRAAAVAVESAERVPGFDNSAMDGYAVRAADLRAAAPGHPAVLALADESRAGSAARRPLSEGEAIAISTGAVIPAGADTVVRIEDTQLDAGRVEVAVAPPEGANLRRAGDDIEPGARLLEAGALLGPAELGVLASVGRSTVECHRPPKVAFVSTGDELIAVDETLTPGAVRNSNAYSLPALARAAGAQVVSVDRAADDPDATREALAAGLEADLLVVCGGVSVGAHDHVRGAFEALGVEQVFWGVSLKPGKPAWFGAGEGALAFGLPGNPVSAYVTFLLFVRPALLAMQGLDPARSRTEARLTEAYEKPADRAHAVRCRLELSERGWLATPAPHQGSHVMTSLLGADALALIPAASTRVEAGELVTVELLP